MATLQQVIQLVFEGVDNASDTVSHLKNGLGDLSFSVRAIAGPFAQLAEAIELTAATAGGMATVIGVIAVKAASEFSSSLNDLDRFLQEGEGSAKDYTETFQSLAVKYGISANDIVQSTADWSAANFKIKDSLDLTTLSLKFATAGQLEAAKATELLKQLMSGLNLEQEESVSVLNKWGDIINFVADASKSDFKELAIAISGLAPSFNTSGASVEQFAAIINSSVELFQSGGKAADGLRTIIGQITTPTKDATASLAKFGITVNEAGVVNGTFFQVMSQIAAKWPSLTAEQQRNAAATLVSAERADQFKNILDTWPQSMAIAESAITGSMGSISREVERALITSEVAFNRFAQSINNLLTSIGGELEPVTVDITNALRDLAQAFQRLVDSGALKPLFDVLNEQGGQLAKLFRDIAANLPAAFKEVDLSPLADAFIRLGDAFSDALSALFGNIDLTTIEGLSRALQLIVDTGAAFVTTLEGIVRGLIPLASGFSGAIEGFSRLDTASKIDFGEFLGAMQTIVIVGPEIAAALLLAARTALDFADIFERGFGGIIAVVNGLQVGFDAMVLGLLGIKRGFLETAIALTEFDNKFSFSEDTINKNNYTLSQLRERLDDVNLEMDAVSANLEKNKNEMEQGWNKATGEAAAKTAELADQLDKSSSSIKRFKEEAKASGDAARVSVKDYDGILAKLNQIDPVAKSASGSLQLLKDVSQEALIIKGDISFNDEPIKNLKKTWDENGNPVYSQIGEGAIKATGAFASVGNAATDTGDKLKKSAKESDDFRIAMEKLASEERIKTIEFAVELNIANLEADTKRIEAAFESVNTTIESTGDVLGDLYGLFGSAKSEWDKLKIESWIDNENKRRDKALEMQNKLIEAQIANIKAKTDALNRGDAIIKIDGTGLAPQLEAFMWEILKAIRIQVNAEFESFLLGTT